MAILLVALTVLLLEQAAGSHMRGAKLSWKKNPASGQIEVVWDTAWQDNYGYNGGFTGFVQPYQQTSIVASSYPNPQYIGFAGGAHINRQTALFTLVSGSRYTFYISSCCRISVLKNGPDQSLLAQMDIDLRNGNTGSPQSSMPPYLTMFQNANNYYPMPIVDPDNDLVTCRFATSSESSISNSPTPYTGLTISSSCELSWSQPPVAAGLYAVQIILQERRSTDVNRVAFDFIIDLRPQSSSLAPTCSLNGGGSHAYSVLVGQTLSVSATARDGDSSTLYAQHLGLPSGATMSPALGSSGAVPLTSTFSWTPAFSQAGSYSVALVFSDGVNQALCPFSVQVGTSYEGSAINTDAQSLRTFVAGSTYSWTSNSPLCTFSNAYAFSPDVTCADDGTFLLTQFLNGDSGLSVTMITLNVAPTILPGTVSTAAGGVATFSFPFTDPGSADTHTCILNYGDNTGQQAGTVSGHTCTATHTYAGAGRYTVQVTVKDSDQGSATSSIIASVVSNVAPVVSMVQSLAVLEGETFKLNPSVTDADGDPLTYQWTVVGNCQVLNPTAANPDVICKDNSAPTATFDITLQVSDGTASRQATVHVSVANVNPTALLGNDGPIKEGETVTLTFSDAADASSADTLAGFKFHFNCGDGVFVGASAGTLDCIFKDDGTYVVVGKISDKDGGFTLYTSNVVVANVNPTATLSNNGPVKEGSPITISFSDPEDESSVDTAHGFIYEFDCDNNGVYEISRSSMTTTCLFMDNGAYTVTGRIVDKDGGASVYSSQVTTTNVAPTVPVSGSSSSAEGAVYTLSMGAVQDPGMDTTVSCSVNWGDGTSSPCAVGDVSHVYDNGPNNFQITVTVADEDGTFPFDFITVAVTNVPPVATLSNGGAITEGSWATVSFANVVDPSTADATAGFKFEFDCDHDNVYEVSSSSSFSCLFADGDSTGTPYAVYGRVSDHDGGSNTYVTQVVVANVAPKVSLTGLSTASEGAPFTLYVGPVVDPGQDTATCLVNWGDASTSACIVGVMSHTYGDGPNKYAVSVVLTDEDGVFSHDFENIVVSNVVPTATFSNDGPVKEGSPVNFMFSAPADPSKADINAGLRYAFDCSGQGGASYSAPSVSSMISCTFPDNGTYFVKGKVIDKDNGFSEYTSSVTVENVAPTLEVTRTDLSVPENYLFTLKLAAIVDPGADTATCKVAWGDATPSEPCVVGSMGHYYLDGDRVYTYTIDIKDEDGTYSYPASVKVTNVAPKVVSLILPSGPIQVSTSAAVTVTYQDPAGPIDRHTADFTFGDGTATITASAAAGANTNMAGIPSHTYSMPITVGHIYSTPGIYVVKTIVHDKDGGLDDLTSSGYVVVYDPNGGFVTGGGWIQSPPGAYTANTELSGKATFGFVSKYQQGKTIPEGNTVFQFQAASFTFKSTVYEWLTIAGSRAQFKGSGSVNGQSGFGFMLTATDADVNRQDASAKDKFRIKIWTIAADVADESGVVYDNNKGAANNAEPTTELGGGSIAIHS
eukprot:gb/GEZN01000197.1/.p1 GENE.gb/GEZN01000197.1/~~gb/GEZN01000197.1/.p1  ORF type:complete len:1504 (-),score=136.48 gb/GEZN01000197.1/:450-4961(-)